MSAARQHAPLPRRLSDLARVSATASLTSALAQDPALFNHVSERRTYKKITKWKCKPIKHFSSLKNFYSISRGSFKYA